jgi:UDPglucose--hexose-1-phosphate uridylyltransferase
MEIMRIEENGGWKVRIVENKFSSVDRRVRLERRHKHLYKEIDGFGIQDVIIENPKHNTTLAFFSDTEMHCLLSAYLKRASQIKENEFVRHIVIFKNQGIKAGGTLEHPHSQIYGLPVVPFEMSIRLREADRYYELSDSCMLCDILKNEYTDKKRIFYENDNFICLSPYAALSPYHFWIVPRSHSPSFLRITPAELLSLSDSMITSFGKLFVLFKNPDFNYVFQSLCYYEREQKYYHWYVSVIPQLKSKGGLEYAGGFYVNPVLPETAAEEMRNVALE